MGSRAVAADLGLIPIRLDQTVHKTQRADEHFIYEFGAEAGGVYLIQVKQDGLDFIIEVEDPAGSKTGYNSPVRRDDLELALIDAAAEGTYRIHIRSEEHTGAVASHAITVSSLSDAPVAQREAWRMMTHAAKHYFSGDSESWRESLHQYKNAATSWRQQGNTAHLGHALYAIAFIEYWRFYNWPNGIAVAKAAAEAYEDAGRETLAARARQLQAASLIEQATLENPSRAQQNFDSALRLFRAVRDFHLRRDELFEAAEAENNIGLTHYYMGTQKEARAAFRQAAIMYEGLDEWSGQVNPVMNQGALDQDAGYLRRSVAVYAKALTLLPESGEDALRAILLDNLARANRSLGNLSLALSQHSNALEIHQSINDGGETWSLLGLGQVYSVLGEEELSQTYLDKAIETASVVNEARVLVAAYRYKGDLKYRQQDYAAALTLHERAAANESSTIYRSFIELIIIGDLIALGDVSRATQSARDAVKNARLLGSQLLLADSLLTLGPLEARAGHLTQAEERLGDALSLYRGMELKARQAEVLYQLARVAVASGDLALAVRYGGDAVALSEDIRSGVDDPELRALYAADRRKFREFQIELLVRLHEGGMGGTQNFLAESFALSERGKARMTLDLLAADRKSGASIGGSDKFHRYRELYESLAELRYRQNLALNARMPNGSDPENLKSIADEMALTENEINLLEAELFGKEVGLGADDADPLTLAETQALLGDDSVLLQYFLGEESGFLWQVTSEEAYVYRLGSASQIESAALSALEEIRSPFAARASHRKLSDELEKLAALILGPVMLPSAQSTMIISADGALRYLPFAVLPVGSGSRHPLIKSYKLVSVPSVSTIYALRERMARRDNRNALALIADPVFTADDVRFPDSIKPAVRGERAVGDLAMKGAGQATDLALSRLIWSGREAEQIIDIVGRDNTEVLVGFDANLDNLENLDLSRFRYVHFATHGLVDDRYSSLSSLALSSFDSAMNSRAARLRVADLYDMKLNADAVVLSACDTALGREISGEGFVGFTQGFMYAGAHRLLMTLWKVPDQATAELMKEFYRYLFTEGYSVPMAARAAQLSLADNPRWSHPYFWGALIVVGDWLSKS